MGQHRYNPVAQANAVPQQTVRALDLGGGAALLGVQLMPVLDEARENLVVLLAAIGGPQSTLVPLEPRPVVLAEVAKIPLAAIVKAFLGGGDGGVRAPETSPPDASPVEEKPEGLVVVP